MKPKALIAFTLLALSAGLLNAEQPSPSYRVIVESGHIVVKDAKNGAYMGGTTYEKFGVTATSTQDKLRHVALDIVAAVVAGNGEREHSVDPNSPVYTLADREAKKATYTTGTSENGLVFVILRDIRADGRYEAKIHMSKLEDAVSPPKAL